MPENFIFLCTRIFVNIQVVSLFALKHTLEWLGLSLAFSKCIGSIQQTETWYNFKYVYSFFSAGFFRISKDLFTTPTTMPIFIRISHSTCRDKLHACSYQSRGGWHSRRTNETPTSAWNIIFIFVTIFFPMFLLWLLVFVWLIFKISCYVTSSRFYFVKMPVADMYGFRGSACKMCYCQWQLPNESKRQCSTFGCNL